jgi:hypothetical protein
MVLHIEWVTTGTHNPTIQVWLEFNSLEGVDVVSLPVRYEACLQNSIECRCTPGLGGVWSERYVQLFSIVWIWHVVTCAMRGRRVWTMGASKSWERKRLKYISMYAYGVYMYIHGIYMVYMMIGVTTPHSPYPTPPAWKWIYTQKYKKKCIIFQNYKNK